MIIAITGHSKGLGALLFDTLKTDNTVKGFSRSNGYDLLDADTVDRVVREVEDCDVFVNNAKTGWGQIEMFNKLMLAWAGKRKRIINIGSVVTTFNYVSDSGNNMVSRMPGWQPHTNNTNFPVISAGHYTAIKSALKAASYHAWENNEWPMVSLVQPGPFPATGFKPLQDGRTWMTAEQVAKHIINTVIYNNNIHVTELTFKSIPEEPNA
jgi:NAD(P)-dependent dehydrogenase (short-subunit alcohol dehydrogenase family)